MNMKIFKTGLAFLGFTVISFVGCQSGDGNADHPVTDTVVISQMKFNPDNITVNKGDTIFFINKDIVPHNVVQVDSTWYSPILNNGDSFKKVAEKSDDYYCSLHLVMKGKITVK